MNKETLKEVIIDQQEFTLPEHSVPRTIYQQVQTLHNNQQIIVITGIRRCGKSTLLQEIRNKAAEKNYYVNFDDDRLVKFQLDDFQMLLEVLIELFGEQQTFYFDEIQNIPQWERFVRRLHDQGNKIYITGSNATMFSRELGTRLTGRYIAIEMYPFSFTEYLQIQPQKLTKISTFSTKQKGLMKNKFQKFIVDGGFPDFVMHQNVEYLHSLYESILYRDIVTRYKINERAIKELVLYLAGNISKEITYNSLRKTLGLAGASTVSDYCSYLEDSFLFFFINRYDHSLKKQLQYAKKVYCIDQAMAKTIGFRISKDEGRMLENIVFLELKRRNLNIYFHKDKKECDFLVREQNTITTAIQVCTQLDNDTTKQREIDGLVEAMSSHKLAQGLIITTDDEQIIVEERNETKYTVNVVPIWKWLLG